MDKKESMIPVIDVEEEDKALACLKEMGVVTVNFSRFNTLGDYIENTGVMRNQRGMAILNQQWLGHVAEVLISQIDKEAVCKTRRKDKYSNLVKLSQTVASVIGRITDSQRLIMEAEGGFERKVIVAQPETVVAKKASFLPGQDVQPSGNTMILSREVHVHNNGSNSNTDGLD